MMYDVRRVRAGLAVLAAPALVVGLSASAPAAMADDPAPGSVQVLDAFPGDNGRIVFQRYVSGGVSPEDPVPRYALMSMTKAGKDLTKLVGNGQTPKFSPDGTKIVFTRNGDIMVMKANGEKVRRLTATRAVEADPSWSPDGTRIVFGRQASDDQPSDLFTMKANGKGVQALRKTKAEESDPEWSPTGRRILYENNGKLTTIRADGTDKTVLLSSAEVGDATWAPSGRRIVLQMGMEVFVMTSQGENLHQLTAGDLGGGAPVFSPDGTAIVFFGYSKTTDEHLGIFRMAADGGDPVQLSVGGTPGPMGMKDIAPDWQPR